MNNTDHTKTTRPSQNKDEQANTYTKEEEDDEE